MARPLRLQVFPGADVTDTGVAHYVRLCGGNGEILMSSEPYAKKANALRAARSLQRRFRPGAVELEVLD